MIRKVQQQDKQKFIQLMKEFYQSDAVLSEITEDNIEQTFNTILEDSPYLDAYVYLYKDQIAGYCLLSFTYSNEAGGLVLLIDELYVSPKFQRKGIGSSFLNFIEKTYQDEVALLRLEVVRTNQSARQLYYKRGFKDLKYIQMVKDIEE